MKASVKQCVLSFRDKPRQAEAETTSCSGLFHRYSVTLLETNAELTLKPYSICLTSHLFDFTCLFLPLNTKKVRK